MQVDVAIVGAGFSGTALAVQLLRRAKRDISIALIDREERIARGVAYSAAYQDQLLNVAAGRMSALADEPGHFLEWLASSRGLKDAAQAFLPRHLYGEYLEDTLNDADRESRGGALYRVAGLVSALSAQSDRIGIECPSNGALSATVGVLATGNYPPPSPAEMNSAPSHRYIRYPWAPGALDAIGANDVVLILGSGLTAIDQIFTLKNRGFRGTIQIVSSRGLLPIAHGTSTPWPCDWGTIDCGSVRTLLRELRRQIAAADEAGIGWRGVVDSLRSHSQGIWNSLPVAEQRRFLRHARTFWDIHRHRVSPEVHGALRELAQENRLIVSAGRCIAVSEAGERAKVLFRRRGRSEAEAVEVHKIINCTGPNTIKRLAGDPLIDSIFSAGIARPDPIGMGLDTGERGELIDRSGKPAGRLFAIGPLRKGSLWETTAVPEIRVQAMHLADHLLELLAAAPKAPRPEFPVAITNMPQSPIPQPEVLATTMLERLDP